jgi:hypothetical protein
VLDSGLGLVLAEMNENACHVVLEIGETSLVDGGRYLSDVPRYTLGLKFQLPHYRLFVASHDILVCPRDDSFLVD